MQITQKNKHFMESIEKMALYVPDICKITGQSYRNARRLFKIILDHYGRPNRIFVSIDDFCDYTGIREERVREKLG